MKKNPHFDLYTQVSSQHFKNPPFPRKDENKTPPREGVHFVAIACVSRVIKPVPHSEFPDQRNLGGQDIRGEVSAAGRSIASRGRRGAESSWVSSAAQ